MCLTHSCSLLNLAQLGIFLKLLNPNMGGFKAVKLISLNYSQLDSASTSLAFATKKRCV